MASNAMEANNGLDSSSRALSRPEILNNSRIPKVCTTLRGKVHAPEPNDEASKRHINTIAERFQGRMATKGEVAQSFFTGASCLHKPACETVGAYSVVFTEMSPNTDDHGKQAEMAWSSRLLRNNVVAEALAVVQALQLAQQRLLTLPPGPGGPKLATVQIFTGALHVFRDIVLTNNAWSANRSLTPHSKLLRAIQVMMFEQSQKLGGIPDLEVDLHLYWLTAESGLESQRAAKRVALQCRLLDGEQDMFTLDGEARLAAEMPPPVYLDVEHALIQKSKDHKEKSNEKSAAVRVPIMCPVGYHDSWYGQSYDPCPEPYVSSFSDPEDFYDSDLEVHESIEISPSPSHPSNPVSYTPDPPPMGGPPDIVSNIPFPGTDKPLWWRDLGPARPTIEQISPSKDSTPSIEQDAVPGTEKATVNGTEAPAEEEDDLMEEHVLEQCIRFMQERRMRGHREEPVLEQWQEVCLKELRLMAPGNSLVRAHEAKRVRINRLLDEIDAMRVDISQRQKLVNEKDKEVRHLARDQPFFFGASFS